MAQAKSYRLDELARHIGAELRGDPACRVFALADLGRAEAGQIAFLSSAAYEAQLATTAASAVILTEEHASQFTGNALITGNPYLGFAKISQLFDNRPKLAPGIHPTAVVADNVEIDESAAVGPHVCIEADVRIDAGVELGAGCFVGQGSSIGEGSRLAANVTVHHGVTLGKQVTVHSGTVIGADGFGFAIDDAGQWEKIAQVGGVEIGDHVEIGACTSIDRGALGNTLIETGVKIDNQVMVAHNVKIGRHTAIAGCVGISGSTEIGEHCTVAGGVGFVGHIKVADRVHVTGMTMVTKSIDEPGSYSSGTAMMPTGLWRKNSVRMRQLDQMSRKLKELERQLRALKT